MSAPSAEPAGRLAAYRQGLWIGAALLAEIGRAHV